MTAPDPWPNGTHLVVRGRIVVVVEHAPNSDSWHYRGTPSDLAGDIVTFAHSEATPVERPITPRPVGSVLPDVARDLMARAGLSLDVFDKESGQHTPLGDLLETVASLVRRGIAPPELLAAYVTYREEG